MKSDMFITDSDALMSLNVLSTHPVFSSFSTASLMELIGECTVNSYSAGEAVVKEGDLVDSVFFILQGQCEVLKHTISANNEPIDEPVATLREEESIGLSDFGLFSTTGSRTASVIALIDTKVLCLGVRVFRLFLKNHPNAGDTFNQQLDMLMRMHFIKSVAPFAAISNQHIREIAEKIKESALDADTIVFKQGDSGDACYIITAGSAEIIKRTGHGDDKVIAHIGENAIFGESALLSDVPRNATVHTTVSTTILKIDKALFNGITHQHVDAQEASMRLQLHHCRPTRVENIDSYLHKNSDGEEIVVLRNTALGNYIQLSEQGMFLWNLFDGELSINEIALHYFRQFNVFHVEDIAIQIMNLHNAGFIQLNSTKESDSADDNASVIAKTRKLMEHSVLIANADEMLTRQFHRLRWMFFSKIALQLWMLIAVLGLASFLFHFQRSMQWLAVARYPWLLVLVPIILVSWAIPFQQLARALTTKFFGLTVHSFGIGWHWPIPFAFCDTSDVWLSPPRLRVTVNLAGIYFNAMLAGLAGVVVYFVFPYYPNLSVALEIFALSSYLSILFRLNPAFESEGYFALMDGLDKPNLRIEAIKWMKGVLSFQGSSIHEHMKELIYWAMTLMYLAVLGWICYLVLSYVLSALFFVSNPVISMALAAAIVMLSLGGLYSELRLRR